jgi:hypothetical protein
MAVSFFSHFAYSTTKTQANELKTSLLLMYLWKASILILVCGPITITGKAATVCYS